MLQSALIDRADDYAAQFARREPFRYVVIENFFDAAPADALPIESPPFEHDYALNESRTAGGTVTVDATERPADELADPHSTVYMDRPLTGRFTPGLILDEAAVRNLRQWFARRDQHNQPLRHAIANLRQLADAQAARYAGKLGLGYIIRRMRWRLRS